MTKDELKERIAKMDRQDANFMNVAYESWSTKDLIGELVNRDLAMFDGGVSPVDELTDMVWGTIAGSLEAQESAGVSDEEEIVDGWLNPIREED